MKFEILIAIIVGAIIGLGGMFGIVKLTSQSAHSDAPVVTPVPTTEVTTQAAKNQLKPVNNTSWDDSQLAVSGTTDKTTFVFLSTPVRDIVLPLANNSFQTQLVPVIGVNTYVVFFPDGTEYHKARVASLGGLPKEKPLFSGTITDIMKDSIQMRGDDGTIEQVTFLPTVSFTNLLKTPKTVAMSDLALGDRVVVLGDRTDKGVIASTFLLVIPAADSQPTLSLTHGKIDSFDKSTLKVIPQSGDPKTFSLSPATKLFGIKSDGTTRTRTKLITKDIGQDTYSVVAASGSATLVRSLFIAE